MAGLEDLRHQNPERDQDLDIGQRDRGHEEEEEEVPFYFIGSAGDPSGRLRPHHPHAGQPQPQQPPRATSSGQALVPQLVDGPPPHLQYRRAPRSLEDDDEDDEDGGSASAQNRAGGASTEHYAGLGHDLTGLVMDNLVTHPFLVLRRQCQVNMASFRTHPTPFSLLPVLVNLHRVQGVSSLWKGLGSALTLRGMTLAVEDLTDKLTPWPKEIDRRSSFRRLGEHLLLKAVSLAVVTPFFSASLVETVQSEIASERPGIFDVFREGFSRLVSCPGRMLPVWVLVPPTVAYGLAHYISYTAAKNLSLAALHEHHRRKQKLEQGAVTKDGALGLPGLKKYHNQLSSLVGHLTADVLLFPMETVLHRLHLQGSRTIIDNLDTGREVVPIMTSYEGFFDCLASVMSDEGAGGLFKGFGALVLQYAVHFAVVRFSAAVIAEAAKLFQPDVPPTKLMLEQAQHAQHAPSAQSSVVSSPRSHVGAVGGSGAAPPAWQASSEPFGYDAKKRIAPRQNLDRS